MAMAEPSYERLKPLLGPDQKGMILIHPDPDSLASAWALTLLFKKNGSLADVVCYESIKRLENRSMASILKIPVLNFKDAKAGEYTRFCLVDAQPSHFPDFDPQRWHVIIDHHPVGPDCPCDYMDIRPEMGATSTLMVDYLVSARVRIHERLATALCYGIMTDTDRFQRNMTRQDARAFSRLFPNVNYGMLRVIEQTEIPYRQLYHFDFALHRLKLQNRRAVIHIGAVESPDIAVILADFFIRVSGIQFVAVSCIFGDKLVIIFRNRNMRKDAGKIASRHFGELGSAGGHRSAARAEVPFDNLPDSVKLYNPDTVEEFIKKRLSSTGKRAPEETRLKKQPE